MSEDGFTTIWISRKTARRVHQHQAPRPEYIKGKRSLYTLDEVLTRIIDGYENWLREHPEA
ncbi:MAG: hypothetical protein ABSA11_10490 [Candidatus Bathyarchaeia archaeon]|jgi:hypothetical protein